MVSRLALVACLVLTVASPLRAQEGKSPELAKQLTQLLDQKKLEAIAIPDAQTPGNFLAALYFPGTQLLVVSGKYTAPTLLTDMLAKKDYQAVYAELVSASVAASKLFVMDTYADGLFARPSGSNAPDSVEHAGTSTTFDGDFKKAKLSEADYGKMFTDIDAAYAKALQSLITYLKSSGT